MSYLNVELTGRPIEVRYAIDLKDAFGQEAHAATYIPQRLIVLDAELLESPAEHDRILAHELLHFAWVRLGNPRRWSWETLLAAEFRTGVHGETGWSAEFRKQKLTELDLNRRTTRWREYCCEAFCDTGAGLWSGSKAEITLARRALRRRERWFLESCLRYFASLPI